jgi:hypothetical protein
MDTTTAPPVAKIIDVEKRVAQFVQLRDEAKAQIEAELLEHLNSNNTKSAKTAAGTVSVSDKTSCRVDDTEAFRSFVVDNGEWDLCDMKANAPAVEKYIEEQQAPPPGVVINRFRTVGVRRASN